MSVGLEVAVLGCHESDVTTLESAASDKGPRFIILDERAEFAKYAVSHGILAVVLGVSESSLQNLELISVIRAVRSSLPVIVIAATDSLEVERRARQESLFYYLLHPVTGREAKAVLADVLRYSR
jgi:DNA-binding NtrC family response regulator